MKGKYRFLVNARHARLDAHNHRTPLDAMKPGLYWISIEAILSRGMKRECHTVMGPTPVIYDTQEEWSEDKPAAGMV
jgi:hypothetical protein